MLNRIYSRRGLLGLLIVAVLGPFSSQTPAQEEEFIPIIARSVRKDFQITNGEKELIGMAIGFYYRARDGSFYQREIDVFGPKGSPGERITLYEASTGKVYKIHPVKRTASVEQYGKPNPRPWKKVTSTKQEIIGRKNISGFDCVGLLKKHPRREQVFEFWFAEELHQLMVEQRVKREDYEGYYRLEDIQAGIDPDPSLFLVTPE